MFQRQGSWPEGESHREGLQGRLQLEAHISRGTVVWPFTAGREVPKISSHRMTGNFGRKVHAAVHCPQWSRWWLEGGVGHLGMVFPPRDGAGEEDRAPAVSVLAATQIPGHASVLPCWLVPSKKTASSCRQQRVHPGDQMLCCWPSRGRGPEQAPTPSNPSASPLIPSAVRGGGRCRSGVTSAGLP